MLKNQQFVPLVEKLQEIINGCLSYRPEERLSADQLVVELSKVCYRSVQRYEGTVKNLIQNNYSGFAEDVDGKIFFSMNSVYGVRRPGVVNNKGICYSRFPGSPHDRGHPVVVID